MSKQIKQMAMDALKQRFQDVRDMVLLSVSGVDAQSDNRIRQDLRKKKIHLHVVKNSLARRVFGELGMSVSSPWTGPTTLVWGGTSLAELSREIEAVVRKNPKIVVKGAVSEGQEVTFQQALAMPTKAEAIGRVVSLAMAPASRLVSQLVGPAGRVASQIKELSKKEEAPAEAAAPAAG